MIQVFKPSYDHREADAVASVLASGWTGTGPGTAMFEKAFAEYCGAEFCIGLSSGTAALSIALKLVGIGPGDEVIIPSITFVAAAHAVVAAGGVPVFSDVLPGSLEIDPDHSASLVTKRTRAVIPVHLGGRPVDVQRLSGALPGIPVIEDCAHAAGARLKGSHVGSAGIAGCFSFHAVKNIAMGSGGALLTNSPELAERAKRLRWLGIDRETWDRTELERSYWWEYRIDEISFSCPMDDIHAAVGLVQLDKLEKANARRREIADIYSDAFTDLDEVIIPLPDSETLSSSWHMYRIEARQRDELNVFLGERGVSTGVHYKPLHLYQCYGKQQTLPVAEKAFESILTLPMYPDLEDSEVLQVAENIRRFYRG